jgi:hypothetical protein
MSANSVEVVVLCEDLQQEVFIRRFLQRRGRERYAFRPLISPAGRGSGEQWVRKRFACELKAHRSQTGRRNTWLIAATDADTHSVDDRIKGFFQACEDAGIPFRGSNEKVMFVVPKRNIETWFAYLRGETVNESDRYPKYDCENDCRPQVARLDDMCRQQKLEPEPPPSLGFACKEFDRLVG